MDALSWSSVWTAAVVVTMVVVLVRETIRPDLTLLGALCLLLLGGVVTPEEAFRGFSSPALVTIAALAVGAVGALQPTEAQRSIDVPLALEIATSTGTDPLPYAVAIAASAGFATPFGYQTNLMVMSAGGYRFADYLRAGLPLNGIVMTVAVLVIWLVWL